MRFEFCVVVDLYGDVDVGVAGGDELGDERREAADFLGPVRGVGVVDGLDPELGGGVGEREPDGPRDELVVGASSASARRSTKINSKSRGWP